jgi:hypothetical protein
MLIGSVSEEGNQMSSPPSEQQWHANLSKTYGEEKATAIMAAMKKAYPDKKIQTPSYICSGRPGLNGLSMRNNLVKTAKLKHDLRAAPAYTYYFTWQTPTLGGLPGAWQSAELPDLTLQLGDPSFGPALLPIARKHIAWRLPELAPPAAQHTRVYFHCSCYFGTDSRCCSRRTAASLNSFVNFLRDNPMRLKFSFQ